MDTPAPRDAAERLFLSAVDADAETRAALLSAAPADVRAEALSLLDADAHAAALLDPPEGLRTAFLGRLADGLMPGPDGADDLTPGTQVGPWTVEAEAGRGGMGAVYRAVRSDGLYDQTVALKVVRRGMDTADVVARFQRERSLLAGLDHAGIARLVDGGRAPDGRPYLAMEFVDGEPFTQYCDARALPVADRLGLFIQVCEAVAYAHRHLVVHRDIKPSNVLVTESGGRPAVKLLDFGVARLLSPHGDETQTAGRMLTPAYAAPEQAAGGAVTTASDVYSLGVLLYEVLTGHRPGAATAVRPSAVVSEPTVRRSAGGETQTNTPEALAAARGATPARLARRLRGDLDAVVLKALRPEPEARYASADALADDVCRAIDGLPVRARRGTARYRAAAFVRRHRAGVAAAALVVVVLSGSAAALAVQNRRLDRERDRAETVGRVLAGIFEAATPENARGDTLNVRELLDAQSGPAVTALADAPEAQGDLLDRLAEAYASLGLFAKSEALAERAVRVRERAHGPVSAEVGESLSTLAQAHFFQGDYDAADPLWRRSLAVRAAVHGPDAVETAETTDNLATLLEVGRGDYEAARPLRERSVAIYRAAGPEKAADYATALNNLAGLDYVRQDYEAAERAYREAYAIRRRVLGPDHPLLIQSLNQLAVIDRLRGDYAAAERLHRQALALAERVYPPDHPERSTSLNYLGMILAARGRPVDALRPLREALALRLEALGPDHPDVAASRVNAGAALRDAGRHADAVASLREGVAGLRAALGDDHPRVAVAVATLAAAERAAGNAAEADTTLAWALRAVAGRAPEAGGAGARLSIATDLLARGDAPTAEPLVRQALALRQRAGDVAGAAEAQSILGACLARRGRTAEATRLLTAAAATLRRTAGPDDPRTEAAEVRLADTRGRSAVA